MKLSLENIKVNYGSVEIIKGLTAHFNKGEIVGVIGPNGTGKTTMIKAIAGLNKYCGNIALSDNSSNDLPLNCITYVPQMMPTSVNLTVFEMVLLGRVKELSWKVDHSHLEATASILEELHIKNLSQSPFSSLSGGQKQIVIMAQALVSNPKILLLDEPTSALDLYHQLQIMDIARHYTKTNQIITLIVLHDLSLAARYCSHLVLLHEGRSYKQGPPEAVLHPHSLEKIYNVKVDVSRNQSGFLTITPIEASKQYMEDLDFNVQSNE